MPEVSELIVPGNRHLMLKIAQRQCLGAFHQSFKWLRDAAGNGESEGRGDRERDGGGEWDCHEHQVFDPSRVAHDLRLLLSGLLRDFFDECRGQRCQRQYLV